MSVRTGNWSFANITQRVLDAALCLDVVLRGQPSTVNNGLFDATPRSGPLPPRCWAKTSLAEEDPLHAPASGISFLERGGRTSGQVCTPPVALPPPPTSNLHHTHHPLHGRGTDDKAGQVALRVLAGRCLFPVMSPVPLQVPFPMNCDRHSGRPASKTHGTRGFDACWDPVCASSCLCVR